MDVHVKGGTNAGRRRPLAPKPGAWRCECGTDEPGYPGRPRPGYLRRCPDCKTARPDGQA